MVGALLLALVAGLTGVPLSAQAAQNTLITTTIDSFTRITQTGEPITSPGQLNVGDYVQLQISFDATNADPVPGDSFSVELPEQFTNIEFGRPGRDIIKPFMFNGIQVGDCLIEQRKFTCTFNDAIIGKKDIRGAISARLVAVATTDDTQVPFVLNSVETLLTIPGTGGIGRRETRFQPNNRLSKGATGLGRASQGVTWNLNVGGAWLAVNKAGETTFTIVDTLPNNLLKATSNLGSIVLYRATPATNGAAQVVARADGTVAVEGYKLEYFPDPDGMTYRFKITVPQEFSDQENYQLIFPTVLTAGGTIDTGWNYTNQFTIEDTNAMVHGEKGYVESFEATVVYEQGFGIFQLTKTASGSGTLADSQRFEALVHYELPSGFTAPQGWTAPPNPYRVSLGLGQPTLVNPQLPAGTKVTVEEDLSVANDTAASGTTWVAPKFSATNAAEVSKVTLTDNGAKASFTIEAEKVLKLNLANTSVTQSTFQVVKRVTGDDAEAYASTTFDFDYECSDGQSGEVLDVPGDGTPVKVTGKSFAVGTVCTVKERQPAERDGYTLTKANDALVTVQNALQSAEMVNNYRRESGEFAVAKVLNANGSRGYDTFEVTYECSAAGYGQQADGSTVPAKGSVKVTAGGETLVGRFPAGTTCQVTGETEQVREGYEFTNSITGTKTIKKDERSVVTVTNTYKVKMGELIIQKNVNANGSTDVSRSDEFFELTLTCTPMIRSGLSPITRILKVAAGESRWEGEIPIGSTCVITREEGGERPGYTLTKDLGSETVIVEDGSAQITVTNTYTRDMGEFSVTKRVEDGGSTGADEFTLTYECSAAGENVPATGEVKVTGGQEKTVGRFPAGTTCAVKDETGAQRDGYTLVTDFGSEVTVEKDAKATVAVTNTYTRDLAPFQITKTVEANGSSGSDEFTVHYVCDSAGDGVDAEGDVTLQAGKSTTVGRFPTGTSCLVESETDAPRDGYTLTKDLGAKVNIAKDAGGKVTVTNTYTRDTAQLRINKKVVGNGSTGSSVFKVDYACDAPDADGVDKGTVEVREGSTTVAGVFPTGTTCRVTAEADAQRDGYTLETDLGASVTLAKDEVREITVTNTYTRDYADFAIAKKLEAGGSTGTGSFSVDYECSQPGRGADQRGTVTVGAGQATRVGAFPTGTVCRVVGEDTEAAERDGYTLGVALGDEVHITKGETATALVTNTYVRQRGGFVITKTVDGDGASRAPEKVPFTYECAETGPVTVQVTPGVPYEVTDVATGACTIAEGDASAPRTDLKTVMTIDGQPNTDGRFTVKDTSTVVVDVANTYTLQRGTFEVTKRIESSDRIDAGPFTFTYRCDGVAGSIKVPGDGTPVQGPQVPLGASCVIAESIEGAEVDNYAVTLPAPQTVTVESEDSPARADFVNTYRRHTAGFSVAKTVKGGPFEDSEFTFGYECGDVTGTVKAKGDGVPVSAGVDLPTGTSCRIWEEPESAERPEHTLTAPGQQRLTLEGDHTNTVVSFVNTYTRKDPTPQPSPSEPAPSPSAKPTSTVTTPQQTPTQSAGPTVTKHPERPGLPKTGD